VHPDEADEFLIQPRYFLAQPEEEALVIYDYRDPGGGPAPDIRFDLLLNGKKLQACSTKDGFFVKVFLRCGTYRVTLRFGPRAEVETLVTVASGVECGLRVLMSPSSIGFDEPSYQAPVPHHPGHPTEGFAGIEVKFAVALLNKEGWDPLAGSSYLPSFYKPRNPLADYVVGRFPMGVQVVGEINFDDKLLVYRKCLEIHNEYLQRTLLVNGSYLLVELLCRPVARGDYRGVVVVVLHNHRPFSLKRILTIVNVPDELLDVEIDRRDKIGPEGMRSSELKRGSIKTDRAVEVRRALLRVAELMDEDPSIIQDTLSELGSIMERVEGSADVLKRKEVADELGLSPERIKDFIAEGRLGVRVGSQHLISRRQLTEFKANPRTTGRPPK
jgi:hypothetical protein